MHAPCYSFFRKNGTVIFLKRTKLRRGGEILQIPVTMLRENPLRARIYYNDEKTARLIASIRRFGIIEPLNVYSTAAGYYVIVSGERRYRAALSLGYKRLPCVLCDTDAENALYMILSNELTVDRLSYFESAVCYEKLHDAFHISYEEIADRLSVPIGEILDRLRFLKIPAELRKIMIENGLGEAYARVLLHLDENGMQDLLSEVVDKHLSLFEAKERAASMIRKAPANGKILTFYKDSRIFRNTIENTVLRMKSAGIQTDFNKTERDGTVEYRIRIPKASG